MVASNEGGIWSESGSSKSEGSLQHAHTRARVLMTGVLKKIGVLPAHCSTKIWKFDKEPEPNAAGVSREAEKWADGLVGTSRMLAAASLPRIAELGSGLEVGFRVEGSGGIHEPPPQQQKAFLTKAARERARAGRNSQKFVPQYIYCVKSLKRALLRMPAKGADR